MSRYEESKLIEHDGRIDEISREIKSLREENTSDKKMTSFRVVAIEFKENRYKSGEEEVNQNLSCGFEITKDFQTESGVVIVMTKWEDKKETMKNVDLRTFSEVKEEVDHK